MKNFLKHHGVQKQKWGVRNGPPYPLDADQVPAEQRKANPKIYSDKDENKKRNNRQENTVYKRRLTRKDIRNMSDREFKRYLDRSYNEKAYFQNQQDIRRMTSMTSPLVNLIMRALGDAGKKAMSNVATEVFTYIGQNAVKNAIRAHKGMGYDVEDIGKALFGKHYKSIEFEKYKRLHPEEFKKDKGKKNKDD